MAAKLVFGKSNIESVRCARGSGTHLPVLLHANMQYRNCEDCNPVADACRRCEDVTHTCDITLHKEPIFRGIKGKWQVTVYVDGNEGMGGSWEGSFVRALALFAYLVSQPVISTWHMYYTHGFYMC